MIERLMQRWSWWLSRHDRCRWCRVADRDPSTFRGEYCCLACQNADAEDQAFSA